MHELLLQATIPSTRHHQVLSVLAGIAAMQPISIHEKHLIFKPLEEPNLPGRVNTSQTPGALSKPLQGQMHGDLFFLKVVEEVRDSRNLDAGVISDRVGVVPDREGKAQLVPGEAITVRNVFLCI